MFRLPFRPRRPAPSRRGTIVLLALAFLAIVSISAIAYVTIVRVDRASSVALAREQNYQQQVTAVVGEIGAILTADLFGNKVVTVSTPTSVETRATDGSIISADVWPRMFEDGESWDYPYTNTRAGSSPITALGIERPTYTYAPGPPREGQPTVGAGWDRATLPAIKVTTDPVLGLPQDRGRFLAAFPDDAWLASYDPIWPDGAPETARTWPQITNLRSTFRFVRDTNGDGRIDGSDSPAWRRQDGLFADLSRFFRNTTPDGYADPAANLLVEDPASPDGPGNLRAERGANQVSLDNRSYTGVFEFNMAQLGRALSDPSNDDMRLDAVDEALWADCDGDNRPDSRWTQLDSLGELYGLRWVVAARIVDASALVNVNSCLEFAYASDPARISTGETPADIDLFRLLRLNGESGSTYLGRVNIDQLVNRTFRDHLEVSLNVNGLIEDYRNPASPPYDPWVTSAYTQWQASNQLTPDQKSAFWRYVGATPDRPAYGRAGAYPVRDMIDLFAFWGTNNRSLVSKLEETIDGPETTGYLPGDAGTDLGPLRARESPISARSFDPQPPSGQPTPTRREIKESVRRLITTVSGVSTLGPVPLAEGGTPLEKVSLRDFVTPPPGTDPRVTAAIAARKPELLKRTVGGLIWALAPFATESTLPPPLDGLLKENYSIRESLAAYPGAAYGAGEGLSAGLGGMLQRLGAGGNTVGLSAAIIPALSLAANLADAADGQGVPLPTILPPYDDGGDPTMIRFFNDPNRQDDPNTTNVIEMGTSFPQGTLLPGALPQYFFGVPSNPTVGASATGVTVIGTEQTLFLTEAVAVSFYENMSGATITAADKLCSVIFFRVSNPWAQRLSTDGYSIRIPVEREFLTANALTFQLPSGGDQVYIQPGQSMVFRAVPRAISAPAPSGDTFRESVLNALMAVPGTIGAAPILDLNMDLATGPMGDPDTNAIVFEGVDPTLRPPVLLTRRSYSGFEIVVDRLSPPPPGITSSDFDGFPAYLRGTTVDLDSPPIPYGNITGGINDAYFERLGYDVADPGRDPRLAARLYAGRIAIWSSLSRPGIIPEGGGFPLYVLESYQGEENLLEHRIDGVVWLMPNGTDPDPPESLVARLDPSRLVQGVVGAPVAIDSGTFPTTQCELDRHPTDSMRRAASNPYAVMPTSVRPFQIHVPNAPLTSVCDVALISTAACTYVHPTTDDDFAIMGTRPTPEFTIYLNNLTTLSEWLRRDAELDHDYALSLGYGVPNPSIGTLDLTRPILRETIDAGVGTGDLPPGIPLADVLPDSLCVPLATRVFDVFESGVPVERLAAESITKTQGRININTAPRDVLRMIPFMAPLQSISGFGSSEALAADADGARLVNAIIAYRDQMPSDPATADRPFDRTNLLYMRESALDAAGVRMPDLPCAVTTVGELSILGRWSPATGLPDTTATDELKGFLYFGAGGPSSEMGIQPFSASQIAVNAQNDAEERLGLFRGVVNSVSTRSDVFIAWFIIRGYDPKAIEGIRVTGSWQEAMMNEAFRPAYESRWLGVFDRSGVRNPTDRPRTLLLIELPKVGG